MTEVIDLQEKMSVVVAEAAALRPKAPPFSAALETLHSSLVEAGAARHRLEELLGTLSLLKHRSMENVIAAREAYEDKWRTAATQGKVGFVEYSSAKEREANIELKALDEKFKWRRAEKDDREVTSALEFVRMCVRNVDALRRDLEIRIRVSQVEGRLG